jgi:adenosylcobinamide-phosphate synthase
MAMTTLSLRSFGVLSGLLADLLLGEPKVEPHPVSAFGAAMRGVERAVYRDRRTAGVAYTTVGIGIGVAGGAVVRSTGVATYLSVAHRALVEAAQEVADALERDDLTMARELLPTLVGRDPSGLGPEEIARAVVESLAENTVDAVVAPSVWALCAGAAGTLGYRAVNTMDATVGYKSTRYGNFGWASARLDDLANYVPARVTAALVVLARPKTAPAVWRAVRRDAPHHPSPNAGVAEAAFAAALGLELGGENTYGAHTERRAALGSGRRPKADDIAVAIALCRDVTYALMTVLGLIGILS